MSQFITHHATPLSFAVCRQEPLHRDAANVRAHRLPLNSTARVRQAAVHFCAGLTCTITLDAVASAGSRGVPRAPATWIRRTHSRTICERNAGRGREPECGPMTSTGVRPPVATSQSERTSSLRRAAPSLKSRDGSRDPFRHLYLRRVWSLSARFRYICRVQEPLACDVSQFPMN